MIKIILFVLLTLANLWLFWKYKQDNRFLRDYSQAQVQPGDLPSDKAVKLVTFIRQNLRTKRCPDSFISPLFRFLRPTPRQVAVSQGDCADKSRLLITLLGLHGVPASKVALYDDKGMPRHAVVEAQIEKGGRMVMDAIYGLYFPRKEGGFYGVSDLEAQESLLRERVSELVSTGADTLKPLLERYPFEKYTYRQPRSINWDKSLLTRALYAVARLIYRDKVDDIRRPSFVERPALMLLFAGLILQGGILLGWLPVLLRKLM